MTRPLRSTVGAAVLASALVFSGTVAHAQSAPVDEPTVSAPIEQDIPAADVQAADEAAPVEIDMAVPLAPTVPLVVPVPEDQPGSDSTESAAPDTGAGNDGEEIPPAEPEAPSGEAVDGAGLAEEGDIPSDESIEGAAGPDEVQVSGGEVASGDPVSEPTEDAPDLGARPASVPAADIVPAEAQTSVVEEVAPITEKETVQDAKSASEIPGADVIAFPEGSKEWADDQWMEWVFSSDGEQWIADNAEVLMEVTASDDFLEFMDAVAPFFLDGDEEGLLAYLNEMYPDDPMRAQFMAGMVLAILIEMGEIPGLGEEGDPTVPVIEEEEPVKEPVEAPAEEPEEVLVVKPVVNVSKPKAPATKPVNKIKPIQVPAPAPALADTGADGMGLAAGAGGGLLLLGVGAMVLRRRKQA